MMNPSFLLLSTHTQVPLTDAQFKQASWDYVQNTATATTKWGDIGDLDVSGVKDFSHAFSKHRNQAGGSFAWNGNSKAATFVGTAISKWDTASATSLSRTFRDASEMNADLTGWKVGKVVTLEGTFFGASKFTGKGLWSWDVAKVTDMSNAVTFANHCPIPSPSTCYNAITTCNKRKIADAWKSNAAFVATYGGKYWALKTCPVRFECIEEIH